MFSLQAKFKTFVTRYNGRAAQSNKAQALGFAASFLIYLSYSNANVTVTNVIVLLHNMNEDGEEAAEAEVVAEKNDKADANLITFPFKPNAPWTAHQRRKKKNKKSKLLSRRQQPSNWGRGLHPCHAP